ncbi:MAG: hypothetical protein HFJ48_02855 [Clostridia bacterium]|nr:hypothetical protein [Clostridia bacterium]
MKNKKASKIIASILLCTILAYTTPVLAYTKDETIYTKMNEKGEIYKTIVSTHLENTDNETIINDVTNLLKIENTNGDESFTQDGNKIVWKADGKDIYYQGETQKELPVKCNITYELNGEIIESKDIIGKEGTVKIALEYINTDEHIIKINNKEEKLYTPFVVVCGTIIDNTNNKNINITNGKVVNDGTKSIVFGMALPGMQESLGISSDTIEIPNKVEITMETTNFKSNNIFSYVTPKVLEENDLEILDKLDQIYSKVNTLQSSSKQIEEGANNLKQGTEEYSNKSNEFNSAMKQVSVGMGNANESYQSIDKAITTLNNSSKTLNSGAKSISEGSEQISTNLNLIAEKLGEAETGSNELKIGTEQLSQGINQLINVVGGGTTTTSNQVIDKTDVRNTINDNNDKITELKSLNEQLSNYVADNPIIQTQIDTNKEIIETLENNNNILNETLQEPQARVTGDMAALQQGLASIKSGADTLQIGAENLSNGISQIKVGTDTLVGKTAELVEGAKNLYNGTSTLSNGAKTLSVGSSKMKEGLHTLDISTNQLESANNQLTRGAVTIKEGASTLSDGIASFNSQAITPICNYINNDFRRIATRVEELQNLSKEYNNFTMLDENTKKANTKFIMITDPIKKED